jgi:hypothetical protein
MTSSISSSACWPFSRKNDDKKNTSIVGCTKVDLYNKNLEDSDTCAPLSVKDSDEYYNGYYIELSKDSNGEKKKLSIRKNDSKFYNLLSHFGFCRTYKDIACWFFDTKSENKDLINDAKSYIDLESEGKKIATEHLKSTKAWDDESWSKYVSISKKKNGLAKKMNARQDCGTWVFFEKENGNGLELLTED